MGPDSKTRMREQINKMENICLLTLSGLDCPGKGLDVNYKTSLMRGAMEDMPIIAGVGYNRVDKSINPPILKSPRATPVNEQKTLTRTINGATDYFNMLYPSDGSEIFNGLYSHGTTATDMIFKKYFEGDLRGYNIQKQYYTHSVQITNIEVTDEFKKIIDILPDQMDEDLYNMVISSFGDSIATKVTYGGVVDLTTSVRSCYSSPSMEQYLDIQLQVTIGINTDTSKLPNGYMRYQRVGSLDIIGGNPQISSISQRVQTFANNPVPVKFETIPIWRAFPNGPKQENMKKIYNKFVSSNSMSVAQMVAQVEAKRQADKLAPQPFYAFKVNKVNQMIEKLGSGNPAFVAAGGRAEFTEEYLILTKKLTHRVFKATVERNADGSFYIHFIRVKCDRDKNCVEHL
ncbi:predicted protein [Naegleria gruberi]|uniref:Predicted protein n=1 Tax=Naegleria gruberi TaxID=5762 RepID=D2VR42_NAEGR|nr:uncharacterized protein NAEGRDRAFT_51592 [Naegleria gruberi]EFC40741.1 predicted protein [Naegleria gruberi]|eukprot:XP_002673485.1 predicted protein [Naegleria gruberi strain NEG-M]